MTSLLCPALRTGFICYDFATGWLRKDGSRWGRPVDVLTGPEGSLFVSDDEGGMIYRIFYVGG